MPRGTPREAAQYEADLIAAGLAHLEKVQTVSDAVEAYVEQHRRRGASARTASWSRLAAKRLTDLHGELEIHALRVRHLEAFVASLDAPQIRKGRKGEPLSMHTRRDYWNQVARMVAWWHKRGFLARDIAADLVAERERTDNPLAWTTLDGQRELDRGKPQLRGAEEVRRYLAAALKEPTPDRRVAAVLPVLTGLDSGEIRHLRRKDVDFDGGALWIGEDHDEWKPKKGSRLRTVPIPDTIRGDLEVLCGLRKVTRLPGPSPRLTVREYAEHRRRAGLRGTTPRAVYKAIEQNRFSRDADGLIDAHAADAAWPHRPGDPTGPMAPVGHAEQPDDYVFTRRDRDGHGQPHDKGWLHGLVTRVCDQAGLPRICPHGLRGTYGTMLQELRRRSMAEIASALGHADTGETARRHYVAGVDHMPVLDLGDDNNEEDTDG